MSLPCNGRYRGRAMISRREQRELREGWVYRVVRYPDGGVGGYRHPRFPGFRIYTDGNWWYLVTPNSRHMVKTMYEACIIAGAP